jgi:hypothetical protein
VKRIIQWGLWGVLVAAGVTDATSAWAATPFSEEVRARQTRLEREGSRPAALVPLLGLLDLWDLVEDRAPILALLAQARQSRVAPADVRARAAYLEAIACDRLG